LRKASFNKFNQFILNPDMANKFLVTSKVNIPDVSKEKKIYFLYIFRQKTPYSFIAIKALLMISSLHTKSSKTMTKIIVLKLAKKQSHSHVYLEITWYDLIRILPLFYKKPASIHTAMRSYINEQKHFIFPGFIKHLKITSWKHKLNLSYQGPHEKNYWLFFYKTAFFD
jgi:hypothetical protein